MEQCKYIYPDKGRFSQNHRLIPTPDKFYDLDDYRNPGYPRC